MEFFERVISFLIENDIALYLAVVGDIIFSFFNAKTTKKLKQESAKDTSKVINGDITALIEYHEKVAKELRKKVGE